MNYQEDLTLIEEGKVALANGMALDAWKGQLVDSGLSQKDIKASTIEVISAVDDTYGAPIQEELMASGTASKPSYLHESVFEKIVERRTMQVQAKLSQIISQQIMDGGQPAAVVEQNPHPLLDANVLRSAFRKANPEDEVKQKKVDDNFLVTLVRFISTLLAIAGVAMVGYEHTRFHGLLLVGLAIIIKLFFALRPFVKGK